MEFKEVQEVLGPTFLGSLEELKFGTLLHEMVHVFSTSTRARGLAAMLSNILRWVVVDIQSMAHLGLML